MRARNRRAMLPLVLWTALAACTACTADTAANFEVREEGIRGGVVDEEHTAIVGLRMSQGLFAAGICSGTLIAPNLVLTARHCGVNSTAVVPKSPSWCRRMRSSRTVPVTLRATLS